MIRNACVLTIVVFFCQSLSAQDCKVLTDSVESLYGKGKATEATQIAELAVRACQDSHDDTLYGTSLNNLGLMYKAAGRFGEAAQRYTQAINLYKDRWSAYADYGNALVNMANLHAGLGEYEDALPLYIKARTIFTLPHNVTAEGRAACLNNLAFLYKRMGLYKEALPLYEEAASLFSQTLGKAHLYYGASLNNIADLRYALGQYNDALPLYEKAAGVISAAVGKDHPYYGVCVGNIAFVYEALGRYEDALPLVQEAKSITVKTYGTNHPEAARCINNIASLHRASGQYSKALDLYKEAGGIYKSVLGIEHPDYAQSLNNIAVTYEALGWDTDALASYQQALVITFKQYRNSLLVLNEADLVQYFGLLEAYHATHSSLLGRLNRASVTSANGWLYNSELFRRGLALNASRQLQHHFSTTQDTALKRLFESWKTTKSQLSKHYALPLVKRPSNTDSLARASEALERLLIQRSKVFSRQTEWMDVSWQQIRDHLGPNEAAVELTSYRLYSNNRLTDTVCYAALVVKPGCTAPQWVPLFEEKILDSLLAAGASLNRETRVANAYAARGVTVQGAPDAQRALAAAPSLYALIWEPLEPALHGIGRVYLASSGALNTVSFAALQDSAETFLLDKHDLVQLASTKDIVLARKQAPSNRHRAQPTATLYGAVDFNANTVLAGRGQTDSLVSGWTIAANEASRTGNGSHWAYLPGTGEEIAAINQLLRGMKVKVTRYTGAAATEEVFKAQDGAAAPGILHIATHGFFFPAGPEAKSTGFERTIRQQPDPMMRSGILLAGANAAWSNRRSVSGAEDGVLTAYEVAGMDLSNVNLVVLSACETGLGDITNYEGVYGLQRAFRKAGVGAMIYSLWQVPDAPTVTFMEMFYRHLANGQPPHRAFRATQLKMSKTRPVYEWGAFVLAE